MNDITIDVEERHGVRYVTKVGFAGYDQGPLLMVYQEHYDVETEELEYASVLYQHNGVAWEKELHRK